MSLAGYDAPGCVRVRSRSSPHHLPDHSLLFNVPARETHPSSHSLKYHSAHLLSGCTYGWCTCTNMIHTIPHLHHHTYHPAHQSSHRLFLPLCCRPLLPRAPTMSDPTPQAPPSPLATATSLDRSQSPRKPQPLPLHPLDYHTDHSTRGLASMAVSSQSLPLRASSLQLRGSSSGLERAHSITAGISSSSNSNSSRAGQQPGLLQRRVLQEPLPPAGPLPRRQGALQACLTG